MVNVECRLYILSGVMLFSVPTLRFMRPLRGATVTAAPTPRPAASAAAIATEALYEKGVLVYVYLTPAGTLRIYLSHTSGDYVASPRGYIFAYATTATTTNTVASTLHISNANTNTNTNTYLRPAPDTEGCGGGQ